MGGGVGGGEGASGAQRGGRGVTPGVGGAPSTPRERAVFALARLH